MAYIGWVKKSNHLKLLTTSWPMLSLWAKFRPVIGSLYPHVCIKFGEFTLKFNELELMHLFILHVTNNWLRSNCSYFINNDEWPPNLPNFNFLYCCVWGQCWKFIISCSQSPKQFTSWRMHCSKSGLRAVETLLIKLWRYLQEDCAKIMFLAWPLPCNKHHEQLWMSGF